MKPKFKQKSPVDSVIIDLIIDHFNIQSLSGEKEMLTGKQFDMFCKEAEQIYYKQVMITEEPGVA
jgi:hypothetical protein